MQGLKIAALLGMGGCVRVPLPETAAPVMDYTEVLEADIVEVLASEEYLADKLEEEAEQEQEGTGSIVGGVYMDDQLNFLIDVPDEWDAEPGPKGGNLRVSMADIHTGVRLEVWAFGGIAMEPRVRGECAWRFQDVGTYRSLRHPDPVVVATCVPHHPSDARVFAYLMIREGWTWQLEVHIPSSAAMDNLSRGESVLSTARWGVGD